jgi:hypothetical protein
MICPKCGSENKGKFKFCVKCGSNLEDPSKLNIEQVDRGGYRSENDEGGFTIGSGTFTINDAVPETSSSLFTADELNDSFDEPYIPTLDPEQLSVPDTSAAPVQPFPQQPQQMQYNQYPYNMQGQPAPAGMYQQPYQQPMMQQPQLIGYDLNGMPIYAPQPVMQPQLIGYDLNGMPIYAPQPMPNMYMQGGMPQQPVAPMPNMAMQGGMPQQPVPPMPNMAMQGGMPQQPIAPMPDMAMQNNIPENIPASFNIPPEQPIAVVEENNIIQPPVQPEPQIAVPTAEAPAVNNIVNDDDDDDSDFFSQPKQREKDMNDVSAESADFSNILNNFEIKKKKRVMSDLPVVNADDLAPNKSDNYTKMFMSSAGIANADDLQENVRKKSRATMFVSDTANADELENYVRKHSKVSMKTSDTANADELQKYEHEHIESIMGNADHAVEAMPKKKSINDEIDNIILPDYMQARKTVRSESGKSSPALPEL